jgi:hypothetical protein
LGILKSSDIWSFLEKLTDAGAAAGAAAAGAAVSAF